MSGNNFKLVVRPNNNSIDGIRTLTNITEQPFIDSSEISICLGITCLLKI